MQNALALYSLKQLPSVDNSSKQKPAKRIKLQEVIANSVKYICSNCHSYVFLTTKDIVQCHNCDNRVVKKVAAGVVKTYNAV